MVSTHDASINEGTMNARSSCEPATRSATAGVDGRSSGFGDPLSDDIRHNAGA